MVQPLPAMTNEHAHCFCKKDKGGNLICCKCEGILIACDKCPVDFCLIHNNLELVAPDGLHYMFNCPVASHNYFNLYKRVPV